MDEYYMKLAIKESKKALKNGDVPVGAVIVKNNKVISKAHNKKEKNKISVAHAEILAISKACKKLKKWRLEECVLYITMEPCMMCCGAIQQSRIKKIVYGVKNENFGYSKKLNNVEVLNNILEIECKKIIQSCFIEKR